MALTDILLAAVLAAFALWANENIDCEPLELEQRSWISAICSRIRFPDVPPDVLLNYWMRYEWLQAYDPSKDLLMRAVRAGGWCLLCHAACCMLHFD